MELKLLYKQYMIILEIQQGKMLIFSKNENDNFMRLF